MTSRRRGYRYSRDFHFARDVRQGRYGGLEDLYVVQRGEKLEPFVPAIDDFYKTVMLDGSIQEDRLGPFFEKWATRESASYAANLRVVLQALLDVAASLDDEHDNIEEEE